MTPFLKVFSLLAVVWLSACATVPAPTEPAADGSGIVLQPSREITTGQPRTSRPAYTSSSNTHPPFAPLSAQETASRSVAALAPPADLWERIRRGYAMPDLDNDLVRDREQWYATRPDYIFRMTERSKKYLFHVVEELELRNMPTELALLPFIESAFNPQAVSSAKAAGMWQFMPATGKYFELKQNAFRDDRRDVLASTRAALDYLQKLYGMFGDWHLALAAYNWGEGSVGRAMAKNQRAGLATGYMDLTMPMETRMYVPKLQAVKNIVGQPSIFNSKLPLIENHPYFQSVTIRRDIDVVLAAKLAEVALDDFKALNPSINRPVIMASGTPQILLPWDNAEVFQRNLESYSGGRLASWTVWVAPTTMRPADAAKRMGISEAEFRAVNAIPPRVLIKAGSSLLVPRTDSIKDDVAVKLADNGQLSLAPEVVLRRTTVKAGKGDSVASIARKFRVQADQVAQWNKVGASASFKPGQQVVVFLPAANKAVRRASSSARAPVRKAATRPAVRGSAGTRPAKR
ncbi:transglycosylase SLT domain-containing protein [Rhodoferax sp. AJA081-3]|uniref:transglycosylase SLT domain-containing protein n=1 Tax=Rhodoferax sp. AJA081-3 TaxID=2752316 RepID=UPI001ADF32A9|nr:transglycosylase SLT domain-containing protein [Rhodoferax sp. AJA081-3]QTN28552.1 transglycosylase SLT domain-containing protein [Rhodoferax sp. AJA081-3]